MSLSQAKSARQACENILRAGQAYNIERKILPGENAVAARMLSRSLELAQAYEELHGKLSPHPYALRAFLGVVLSTAAHWSPEKIAKARVARSEINSLNLQIAEKAAELGGLLDQRTHLSNTSGFSSATHYHVVEIIDAAANLRNHLFATYVQEHLDALRGRFDLKYWPTPSQFVQEVARDAGAAVTEASDPLTAAATAAIRPSRADFFKALLAAIEENGAHQHGQLPSGFKISDGALAALATCALDLGPADLVVGPYVKRLRQRERDGAK